MTKQLVQKIYNLWKRHPTLTLANLLLFAEPALGRTTGINVGINLSDEDFEWAIDHYDDPPPGGH